MVWEQEAKEKLDLLISKLPFFHRHIAETVVIKKAEELAAQRQGATVNAKDLTRACLSEVPEVFRNFLDELLKEIGLE